MERFTIHYPHDVQTATKKSMERYAPTTVEMEAISSVGKQNELQGRKS